MFSGNRQAYIGIGGGSDCIQAAMLAVLSGSEACVISIRRNEIGSQTYDSKMGEARTIKNHGGEVGHEGSSVYRVNEDTTGSGRFLEPLIAELMPIYYVIDNQDGKLTDQINIALTDFKIPDAIIAVDTGGDALYRVDQADDVAGVTSPDQDICSLLALAQISGIKMHSAIIAKGLDTPDYADEVLKQAKANFVTLNDGQKSIVLDLYKDLEIDGSNQDRYGKTAFAWQAALRGETGDCSLPLPNHLLNHPTNPWNPVVDIKPEMAGIYVMDLLNHVAAISSPQQPSSKLNNSQKLRP